MSEDRKEIKSKKIEKEFKLTSLALNNKNTVFILLVIISQVYIHYNPLNLRWSKQSKKGRV